MLTIFTICVFIVNLNQEFQSEHPKIHTLFENMAIVYKTFLNFYLKPEYKQSTPLDNIQKFQNYMDLGNL